MRRGRPHGEGPARVTPLRLTSSMPATKLVLLMTDGTSELRHLSHAENGAAIELLAAPALGDDAASLVFDYLLGRRSGTRTLDGSRSVVLPSPGTGVHGAIKIKGAGLEGARVRLGTLHSKPYALPRYDAEGAATVDVAKDHGRAFAGGMSYQQARHEYIISSYLLQRGVRVLPPLGYGVMRRAPFASWFCLLDVPPGPPLEWWQMTRKRADVERVAVSFALTQRELARHDIYLVLSGLLMLGDELIRKDFHTAHLAGANDSFLTRLSYFLFDANFILAQFVIDGSMPDIADHRQLAKTSYIRALTGQEHAIGDIERFKRLLVELKFADWPMEQRMARIADDPVGRPILDELLSASGERALFGELPPPTLDSSPSDDTPSAPEPPRRRFPWLRRRK